LQVIVRPALGLLDLGPELGTVWKQRRLGPEAVEGPGDLARALDPLAVELQRRHRDTRKAHRAQRCLGDHGHQIDALVLDSLAVEHHRRRPRRMGGGDHVELRGHGADSI
jgi:hypothetical protein